MTFPREGKFTSSHFFALKDVMGKFRGAETNSSNQQFTKRLVSHYSAIGDTTSCDAPYTSEASFFCDTPLVRPVPFCDRPFFTEEVGV